MRGFYRYKERCSDLYVRNGAGRLVIYSLGEFRNEEAERIEIKKKKSAGEVTKLILKDNSEISCKELNPLINPHKG